MGIARGQEAIGLRIARIIGDGRQEFGTASSKRRIMKYAIPSAAVPTGCGTGGDGAESATLDFVFPGCLIAAMGTAATIMPPSQATC